MSDKLWCRISLKNDSIFAKLQADLYLGLLRFVTFKWACSAEYAILEALATAKEATTTHTCCLVAHGESVYQSLRFLKSVTLDILSILATKLTTAKWEKEEIALRLSTTFGMNHGALCILNHQLVDLHYISDLWREASNMLSLGIHVFNGVQSDLAALSKHQMSPHTIHLYVLVDQQNQYFKEWVRRLEAQCVLMPAQAH
jgi:hypothetical protein